MERPRLPDGHSFRIVVSQDGFPHCAVNGKACCKCLYARLPYPSITASYMSLCCNRDFKARLGNDRRRFGGDVSSMEWRSGAGKGTRSYDFAYDCLGRLVSADYGEYGDHVTGYGTSYSYGNMGNLLSLSREGDITSSRKGIVDNLSMTYDGGTDC